MHTADLIIKNAKVYTMNDSMPKASAVAVNGEKIIYVGDERGCDSLKADDTIIIDVEGSVVLPGLVDAHAHILSMPAMEGIVLDISMDLEQVLYEIKTYVEKYPEKDSYFGQVYLETCVSEEEYNKETLDSVCPDKPLILLGSTCHEEWVNSKAMEIAGVDRNTPDPIPGKQYFVRDEKGNPTGRLKDIAPFEMIVNACKLCATDSIKEGLKKFMYEYNSLGITTVADCGVLTPANEEDTFDAVEDLLEDGGLTCRIMGCEVYTGLSSADETIDRLKAVNKRFDDDMFRIKTFKLLQDGCYEARSGSCYEPYLDTEFNRPPSVCGSQLDELFAKVARAGFDIHSHCLGNRAIHETLEAAGAARKAGCLSNRFTIAHNQSIDKRDIEKYAKYDVVANFTPQWCVVKPDLIKAIGQKRHDDMFRFKSIVNSGAKMTIGSDCPSDELGYEPWKGIEMSVTRQKYGMPHDEIMGDINERLDIMDALKACTINGAYQLGMEDKIGSIEEGKYADIIILDRNIFDTNIYDIHDIRPVMTLLSGRIVYQKSEGAR